ncbi:MAG: aldehyde dehydrogenase, partial [Candidatus Limivivens sp.]|nr:aldehyde dehydrogenase [Candidatus Limivivens sp.]
MAINEQEIQNIVRSVLKGMAVETPAAKAPVSGLKGIFKTPDEAIAAAKAAQKEIQPMPLEFREKIISNIRKKTLENAKMLSELAVEETGMGNVGHKIIKHQLVAEKTPGTEDLSTIAWSGDRGLTLTEMGPWGVIGAVCPSTNPTATVICNSIGMLAAGNAVVFMPHPSAKNCSNLAIDMVNRASIEVGGPANIVTAVEDPTMEVSNYIFKHKDVDMLCATGGPGVVTAVLSSGKRAMGAGAGNPPVLVDETANIPKAAEDIINGCTFDNNLPCIAEKEVVAVDMIADELIYHMEQAGCYHASPEEVQKLVDTVLEEKNGKKIISRKCVGRSAKVLLSKIGVTVGDDIRCIIFEGEKTHPLIWTELMMPILGIVRVK